MNVDDIAGGNDHQKMLLKTLEMAKAISPCRLTKIKTVISKWVCKSLTLKKKT